jgi:peptidoglycan/xylan/chitin deacetylase (PgdA/CDA1 family)
VTGGAQTEWCDAIARELDLWDARLAPATLWWRDDDACRDSPALQRLLATSERHGVPLLVAAVPANVEPGVAQAIAARAHASIAQHGYAHRNHAPPGERSAELGAHRPVGAIMSELDAGRARLAQVFGERSLPVLVPPWNRIHAEVVARLAHAGFRGLSTFGPRRMCSPVAGLTQCNTHVDVIAWRAGRGFIGAKRAALRIIEHLAARRAGSVDPDEPTGILTHHLDLDENAWDFLDALLDCTRAHPACTWRDPHALFA